MTHIRSCRKIRRTKRIISFELVRGLTALNAVAADAADATDASCIFVSTMSGTLRFSKPASLPFRCIVFFQVKGTHSAIGSRFLMYFPFIACVHLFCRAFFPAFCR